MLPGLVDRPQDSSTLIVVLAKRQAWKMLIFISMTVLIDFPPHPAFGHLPPHGEGKEYSERDMA